MSNSAWILMGKEQLLVPREELGMAEEGQVPAGVEVGTGDVLWALGLGWSTRKTDLDGEMWERIF